MFLNNSFIDQTNLLRNRARFEKPTLNLNRSINCPPLRQPLVANSCDDFFRMVTKSRCFSRFLWTTSNRHRLSSRRGYHYFRMFQFGFWTKHCVTIYLYTLYWVRCMTGRLMRKIGTYSDGRQTAVLSCRPLYSHLHLVCTWYFGILESRIPLTVKIIANMCFNVEFLLCRWISFPVVISLILVQCFPKVLLSAKVLVGGICHSVKVDLIIDSDGMRLGNDRIAVQIAESLVEDEVPSKWMFSMRAWHIRRVFLNGASLYDHDQWHIYNAAVHALNRRPRRGV
jgi:hypothetical protein